MSLPIQPVFCTRCDFKTDVYGKPIFVFYVLPDGSEVLGHRVTGWCVQCNDIKDLESGNAATNIREELVRLETTARRGSLVGLFRRLVGSAAAQAAEIEGIKAKLRLAEPRMSKSRCLTCGSESIQPLTFDEDGLSNNFAHCSGGRLKRAAIEPDAPRFSYGLQAIYLDIEGNRIGGPKTFHWGQTR